MKLNLKLQLPLLATLFGGAKAWLDITAKTTLDCGNGPNDLTAGYFDLPTGHMFFTLFHAQPEARSNGLVIYFGGGPGASSWDTPLLGAGPCQLKAGENGTLEPSPYPWTNHVNLLALDYPIGSGWSYADAGQSPPNSSQASAEDFDLFLQGFYTDFPEYLAQPLIIQTVSYGGYLAAFISELITKRNQASKPGDGRIVKYIDQLVLGNAFGDVAADLRWRYNTTCVDQPPVFPQSTCDIVQGAFPQSLAACEDALLYADDVKTVAARKLATAACVPSAELTFTTSIHNRYNRNEPGCASYCFWWQKPLINLMNMDWIKTLLNVRTPDMYYWYVGAASARFGNNADNMQLNVFKHYSTAVYAGTKFIMLSGQADTQVPWRGSLSWMRRLDTPYLQSFRSQNDTFTPFASHVPASGGAIGGGTDYSLLRVVNASHFVQQQNPELMQQVIVAASKGYSYNPIDA